MILKLLLKSYNNLLKDIKNMKNSYDKKKLIGSMIDGLDGKGITIIAKQIGCSYRYAKKCYLSYIGETELNTTTETRGRKPITVIFPNLLDDLISIINNDIQIQEFGTNSIVACNYWILNLEVKMCMLD